MQYHLLIFMDILRKHNGKFFTKLDMSMQHYTVNLFREAKSLHDHNPFQEVQVQLLVYGSKMFSRHCTSSHEKSPVRHCS
jgi:hypothetical protein